MSRENPLQRIADDFRRFATDFDRMKSETMLARLAIYLSQSGVRCGRLLFEAIDEGVFPWWDRSKGQLPIDPLMACPRGIKMSGGEFAHAMLEAQRDVPQTPEQFEASWIIAITQLERKYPSRFLHNAGGWNIRQRRTDEKGKPLKADGTPMTFGLYRDGVRIGDASEWNGDDSLEPGVSIKWDEEWGAYDTDYTEAQAVAHQQFRAEVYADACRLTADLIDDAIGDVTTTGEDAPSASKIPKRIEQVGEQFKLAHENLIQYGTPRPTDEECYKWARSRAARDGDRDFPSLETWKRHLRGYRKLTGTQKNKSRRGRAGRSVVPRSHI